MQLYCNKAHIVKGENMNYHNIVHDDMLNGDGIRVTLFVSGCSLHCPFCQNPETWDKDGGILFDDASKKEIFEELEKEHISGITLTGGHPLEHYNIDECTKLCKDIKSKYPQKTIWLYTGFEYENVQNLEIMNFVDIVVDGSFVQNLKDVSLKWRGSSNQRVIDVKKSKQQNKIILHCD